MKVLPFSFDARVGHEIETGAMARVPHRSMRAVKHSSYEVIRQIGAHQPCRYGTPRSHVLKPLKTLLDCE
jgi:hypothetical protein